MTKPEKTIGSMFNDSPSMAADHLKLQAILESAIDAIITIDELGIIESVNPATQNLFHYTAEELIGQNVNILMPSPYHEEHDGYIQSYLSSGTRKVIGIGREVLGRRKDGSMFPLHLAVSEIAFAGRRLFTGIVRDISDLKEAKAKLEQLNSQLEGVVRQRTDELRNTQAELVEKEKLATLGQVSGGIAHEIRNPLNAVKTSTYYLLNAKTADEAKRREYLERIDRQVTAIDNVITALSDVAKLPEPKLGPVEPEVILAEAIQGIALPPNVTIEMDVPPAVRAMRADEFQIPIVFRNLVRNARDAMPDGGTIKVSARQLDDKIAIDVTDAGIGIEAEQLERILEPLYSTKARGMGLGLAICNAIIRKNGGQLHFRSEPGQGSTFTVELAVSHE